MSLIPSELWDTPVSIKLSELTAELQRLESNAERLAHDNSEYRAFGRTMLKFIEHLGHEVGYDEGGDRRRIGSNQFRQNAILVKNDIIIIGAAGAMTDRKDARVKDGWIPVGS